MLNDIIATVQQIADNMGVTIYIEAGDDAREVAYEIRDAFYTYGADDVADFWIERIANLTTIGA